jgi:ribosome biogenesis GTPase
MYQHIGLFLFMEGIVIKSTGSWLQVKNLVTNEIYPCRIRGKFRLEGFDTTNPIAVGDRVVFDLEPNQEKDTGIITTLHPRNNYLIRKSNKLSKKSQIIATNLDLIMPAITLLYPKTSRGFVDRILLTAEAYKIPVLLVFNKIDLYGEELADELNHWHKVYTNLGYECINISTFDAVTMDLLFAKIQHKTSLVCGHSGAGKSSMLNAFKSNLKIKTANLSMQHDKGKHTTTFAEMHEIADDTFVVDTPGIRDFGIIDMQREEIAGYFPEFRALMHDCRFSNCVHVNEPGCAVTQALNDGAIDPERYYNYLGMIDGQDLFQ